MTYIAKPYLGREKGRKEFATAKEAVKYLLEETGCEEYGNRMTAEDWVMIEKLVPPAGVYFRENKEFAA
jgi:hypothetical protein